MKPLYSNATRIAFRGKHAFVWEAVKLFENSIVSSTRSFRKCEDKCTQLLSSNNVYIIYKIVTNLNVRAAVLYIPNSQEKKTTTKQMLFILFTCLNVGNDLNFAFSL